MNKSTGFITTSAILVASTVIIAITAAQTAFADSDRCVSSKGRVFTTPICYTGPFSKESAKEFKQQCKDSREERTVDKCSSSQTGYGEYGNYLKPNK